MRFAAAGAILTIAVLSAAAARADGPVYLDETMPAREGATIERISGWSEFVLRGSRTSVGDFDLNETIFAPGLHLATEGGLYERKLAVFRAGGTLSWQHRSLSGAADDSDDLTFEDYRADVGLLPEKNLSANLFADRGHGWHSAPYKSSTRTRTTVWGAGLNLGWSALPTTLTWSREEYLEEETAEDRITTRDRLRLGVKRRGGPVRASLTLRHENFDKNIQPQDYATDAADARAAWRASDSLGLDGSVHWLHRYGSRANTNFAGRAGGRWRPGHGLEMRAEHALRRLRPGAADTPETKSLSGDWSVRHLLYGSLETTASLRRQDETTSRDGDEIGDLDRTTGTLRLDYRRRLDQGSLSLSAGRSHMSQERTGTDGERMVANEEHTLPELAEIRLENPDVVAGSIVVTDASGFVVYVENVDWARTETAGYTFLHRVPTGAIAADESIRVDYRYRVSPDLAFDADTWNLAARFDARRAWSVWARRTDTDETLVSGTPDAGLQDRVRTVLGGLARRGPLTLSEEYETHRLADTRFKTNRLQLNGRFQPARRWRLNAGASHTWSRTEWPRRTQRYLMLNARAAWSAAASATASLETWMRWNTRDDGTDAPNDALYGGRLRWEQSWRRLRFDAEIAWNATDRNEIDDRRLVFRTGLRRVF